ncbi:MAG TPA: histidine kinase [Draconibacterium sp.]|nr:histidine kinase [Draconibacterium sp.]
MKIFKYRVLNHILFWIFIFTFYTIPYLLSYGFVFESFINIIYIPVDIVGVYIVIGYLMPRYVFKNRNFGIFIFGTALIIVLNIAISFLIKLHIQPLLGFKVVHRPLNIEIFSALLNNFMIIGTATAFKLFSYSYNIQLTQSELERKTVQSELGILRSQVNPHFLFNVLNNIDALIFEDKEKASNAILLLSKIMRYMLQESTCETVKLQQEISYIHNYLELAQLSFADPEFLRYEQKGSPGKQVVPPLLFIPIIENAVKHCNKQSKSPGIIIKFTITPDGIKLHTSNFIKRNDFKLPDSGTGTGLKNVEKRLKLLYGNNYTFDIKKDIDKFDVDIKIPVEPIKQHT